MDKDTNLFEEIRRKLTLEEEVTPKEYMYFLAVAQVPQLKFLQTVKGDCLADRTLLKCTSSMQTASQEGYEQAVRQFEEFKTKTDEVLNEQIEKDYDNKMFNYNRNVRSLEYQKKLFDATQTNIEKFKHLPDFYAKVTEFLTQVQTNLAEQEKSLVKPEKETVEQYKTRIIESYEKGLKEYAEVLEKEKDYTIAGIDKFVADFMEVLDACEENK